MFKKGVFRPYFSTTKAGDVSISQRDLTTSAIIVVASLLWRFPMLDHKATTRESQLARIISAYIGSRFTLDAVTIPALGKQMLVFVASALGSFEYSETYEIPPGFPLYGLRFVSALCGSVFNVATFQVLRAVDVHPMIALIGAAAVCADPLLLEETTSLSLNSVLLMFLSLTVLAWFKFIRTKQFSAQWCKFLLLVSIFGGITASVKSIGGATLLWILGLSVVQMWVIVGDLDVTRCQVVKHAFSRVLFVGVPVFIFVTSFYFQFATQTVYSPAAMNMSRDFKSSQFHREFSVAPVKPGDTVVIRHVMTGNYLHSSDLHYKGGSREQAVTGYEFEDSNNEWIITNQHGRDTPFHAGSSIALQHKNTGKFMRASDVRPPVSEQDYDKEVSCIVPSEETKGDYMYIKYDHTLTLAPGVVFSLRSSSAQCDVISHPIRLPEWGMRQQEVVCLDPATQKFTEFYIETVVGSDNTKQLPPMTLLAKIGEFVKRQASYQWYDFNYGAKPVDHVHNWPFVSNGLQPVWICCVASIVSFFAVIGFKVLAVRTLLDRYVVIGFQLVLGWFMHYYVFTKSSHSNLYVAQYLPSWWFSLLLLAFSIDCIVH